MTARVNVRPRLLEWACERAGEDVHALAGRFPKLAAWISETEKPTFKQLEGFAHATHTPLGYMFLPEPPQERLPMRDFRTVSSARAFSPSSNLLETVYAMQRRQAWLRDTLIEGGAEPLSFVGSAKLTDPPESAGAEMRRLLGLEDGWAGATRTWQLAVSELRRRIEQLGIMAVINGIVGNDTHRRLDVGEFRGFAMTDPHAPLIFVNGADAKSAQMFTLAHELAHVWVGAAGLSGFEGLFPPGTDVEKWCDGAAAELLVPAQALKQRWPDVRRNEARFQVLAREFKISPVVAARRALDLLLIGREEFFNFYNAYTGRERRATEVANGGGDFYNNQNMRVGELFAKHVIHAALEGQIGFKEAYALTALRGGTFEAYASKLGIAAF
jgi:Zn-dependent peptidase ImmA (M78 family)